MLGYYGTVCPAVRSTYPEMSDEIFSTKQQCIASLGIEPVARSLNIVEYGIIWLTILEKNGISTLRQRKLRAAWQPRYANSKFDLFSWIWRFLNSR